MGKNRICELLGIKYPIIQAPMNWVSGAKLVAAVSNSGGLGTLGPNAGAEEISTDVEITGERMRAQIKKVRSLTAAPFAVNLIVGGGEGVKYSKKIAKVLIEEEVPIAIISVGRPDIYTHLFKNAGIKVIHAISTPEHAKKAETAGVDAVVCEGFEAGGHKGFTELTTLTLIPMVADVVRIPIIAGGGIGDSRGVLAVLALGADGAYLGTRFMATHEAESHMSVKEAIIKRQGVCTVSIPKDYMLARDLTNNFTGQYIKMHQAGASKNELADFLNSHSQYHSQRLGKAENAEICCGQVAGMINELKSASSIVDDIVKSISKKFEELKQCLACFS